MVELPRIFFYIFLDLTFQCIYVSTRTLTTHKYGSSILLLVIKLLLQTIVDIFVLK